MKEWITCHECGCKLFEVEQGAFITCDIKVCKNCGGQYEPHKEKEENNEKML